jgi:hypothetical protein
MPCPEIVCPGPLLHLRLFQNVTGRLKWEKFALKMGIQQPEFAPKMGI